MNVGLFIPCYVRQYYPRVAIASLDLLEKFGCTVTVPADQTCCGQPFANAGFASEAGRVESKLQHDFRQFDYVVTPSASCALHIVEHVGGEASSTISDRTFELCQFLYNVIGVRSIGGSFPHKVGVHQGCHGLRGLGLGPPSEMKSERADVLGDLLTSISDLELVELERPDECCGFGGTFAVSQKAISVKMGWDRLRDHKQAGAEFIVSADMSCLMHLEGLARRRSLDVKAMHIAELMAQATA